VGVIVREELFSLLGRLYGRDVLRNREVSRVLRRTKAFSFDQNIFAVADALFKDGYGTTNEHYLLVNDRNEFEGVFSTRDLLVYLSEMTRRDVALARALQKRIVREHEVVTRPAFHLIAGSLMAQEIGGDFYAVREYRPGHWAMAVCDVSGKGIAASLLTSVLGGMFSIFDFSNGVRSFVQELNRYTYRTFEIEKFVTGVFLDFDETSGEIVLYDMGHSYLYLRKGGKILKLKSTTNNVPLGVTDEVEPEPNRCTLQPAEALLLFTDGVVDQEDPEGNPYPIKRAEGILNRFEHMGFRKMKDMLLEDLRVYRGPVPQSDDVTVLMLEYAGTGNQQMDSKTTRTTS
jgi:sigma-B regulation protein RsbU (phosphoserine phosphatase)